MLKYFNSTKISTFSFSTLFPSNFPVMLVLELKYFESLVE